MPEQLLQIAGARGGVSVWANFDLVEVTPTTPPTPGAPTEPPEPVPDEIEPKWRAGQFVNKVGDPPFGAGGGALVVRNEGAPTTITVLFTLLATGQVISYDVTVAEREKKFTRAQLRQIGLGSPNDFSIELRA